MRVTRAYLAGFGTSGSLLAGAALVFLLASAFVAFQGWPQVGAQSSPVLVSVPGTNLGGATRASRLLTTSTAAPGHLAPAKPRGRGLAANRHSAHLNPALAHRGSDRTGITPVSSDPGPASGHPTADGPTSPPVDCASGCPAPPANPLSGVRRIVTGAASGTSSAVQGVVTTVNKILPGGTGSKPGGTVGGVTTTAGNTVTTVTKAVGGATGGLP